MQVDIFNIDNRYQTAVQGFNWEAEELLEDFKPSDSDIDGLVNEVSTKIITAYQIRSNFTSMAGRDLSLLEMCYISTQENDKKWGLSSAACIEGASLQERKILHLTVNQLSKGFTLENIKAAFSAINADDLYKGIDAQFLKTATLLFAIKQVHDLAAPKIEELPAQPQSVLQQLEEGLAKMISFKNQFDGQNLEELPQAHREFLGKLDVSIAETKTKIENIRNQPEEKIV